MACTARTRTIVGSLAKSAVLYRSQNLGGYRELLDQRWAQTDWTRPQAQQVLGRMDRVLEQLPTARERTRQRILAGQLVGRF